MLELKKITKSYKTKDYVQNALHEVSIEFRRNEFVSILGASGSGKTTMLNIIGGLGDAAKAFPKAFKNLLGNEDSFGEDNFHLLYALNNLVKRLERSAYSAISQVEILITKWCDAKASEDEIEKCEEECMKKVDLYDNFAEIATWVRDGLEMIDLSSGEIRDSEINGWLLDLACSEMKELEHKKIKKMGRRIKNHQTKLLKHLDWLKKHLSEPINQLHQELGDQEIESYIVNLVARYWRVNHAVEGLKYRNLRTRRNRLREELEFWTEGDSWFSDWTKNVFQLFSSIQGTSSAVENINSILKPMIKNKKHFGSSQKMENFVALFALWHNLRRFEDGKRKGKSPFEILGIETESDDWRTLLGYPPAS